MRVPLPAREGLVSEYCLADDIESWIVDALAQMISEERLIETAKIRREEMKKRRGASEVRRVQKEINEANRKIQNLVNAISDGRAPRALVDELTAIESEKDVLEAHLDSILGATETDLPTNADIRLYVKEFAEALSTGDPEDIRACIIDAVDSITVYPDGRIVALPEGGGPGLEMVAAVRSTGRHS